MTSVHGPTEGPGVTASGNRADDKHPARNKADKRVDRSLGQRTACTGGRAARTLWNRLASGTIRWSGRGGRAQAFLSPGNFIWRMRLRCIFRFEEKPFIIALVDS